MKRIDLGLDVALGFNLGGGRPFAFRVRWRELDELNAECRAVSLESRAELRLIFHGRHRAFGPSFCRSKFAVSFLDEDLFERDLGRAYCGRGVPWMDIIGTR